MDLNGVAAALLDNLPANRTLGLTIAHATAGAGEVILPVREPVHNIIGALHAGGMSGGRAGRRVDNGQGPTRPSAESRTPRVATMRATTTGQAADVTSDRLVDPRCAAPGAA